MVELDSGWEERNKEGNSEEENLIAARDIHAMVFHYFFQNMQKHLFIQEMLEYWMSEFKKKKKNYFIKAQKL